MLYPNHEAALDSPVVVTSVSDLATDIEHRVGTLGIALDLMTA